MYPQEPFKVSKQVEQLALAGGAIVTGGLSGFGLMMAREMAVAGGRSLHPIFVWGLVIMYVAFVVDLESQGLGGNTY